MTATPRVFTTMLSGRSLGGGVAWVSQACASTSGSGYGYSFSGSLNGSFPYPLANNSSSNWDIIVVSHEIGHNMSARHTHELGLDDCYLSDGSGLGACTKKASGTIMSYCHLCSGGYANIALNFDSTNITSIISHIGSKSCTQPSVAVPVAIADTSSVMEGSTIMLDVLANDSANNCESVSIQGLPATSALGVPIAINPTGSPSGGPAITYNPGIGIRGTDSFTYTLKDTSNQVSVPATVTFMRRHTSSSLAASSRMNMSTTGTRLSAAPSNGNTSSPFFFARFSSAALKNLSSNLARSSAAGSATFVLVAIT
jgi:hypothetical protein